MNVTNEFKHSHPFCQDDSELCTSYSTHLPLDDEVTSLFPNSAHIVGVPVGPGLSGAAQGARVFAGLSHAHRVPGSHPETVRCPGRHLEHQLSATTPHTHLISTVVAETSHK